MTANNGSIQNGGTRLDGNYDVVVINESPGADLSVFPLEDGFTIDEINGIQTAYSGGTGSDAGDAAGYNVSYDPPDGITDFDNHAVVSSLA